MTASLVRNPTSWRKIPKWDASTVCRLSLSARWFEAVAAAFRRWGDSPLGHVVLGLLDTFYWCIEDYSPCKSFLFLLNQITPHLDRQNSISLLNSQTSSGCRLCFNWRQLFTVVYTKASSAKKRAFDLVARAKLFLQGWGQSKDRALGDSREIRDLIKCLSLLFSVCALWEKKMSRWLSGISLLYDYDVFSAVACCDLPCPMP